MTCNDNVLIEIFFLLGSRMPAWSLRSRSILRGGVHHNSDVQLPRLCVHPHATTSTVAEETTLRFSSVGNTCIAAAETDKFISRIVVYSIQIEKLRKRNPVLKIMNMVGLNSTAMKSHLPDHRPVS